MKSDVFMIISSYEMQKAADIVRVIKKNAKGLVTNIEIFDLYKNAVLNTDSKSIA